MNVGDKIRMCGEKQRYTVQGFDDNFIVATKPFNARKTYLYTLIDKNEKVRGPMNMIFGLPNDVDSPEGAQELLEFMRDDSEVWGVSYRRRKDLTEPEMQQLGIA